MILLSVNNVFSQSLLVDGAEWHYTMIFWGQPGFEYNRIWIEGDTTLLGRACKIMHREQQTCDQRGYQDYIYQDEGVLYYYEKPEESFKILYDFNVQLGDTFAIKLWDNFENNIDIEYFHNYYALVDSIYYLPYDTILLEVHKLKYDIFDPYEIEFEENQNSFDFIESIGGEFNFFHFPEDGSCDWYQNIRLRCFNHPEYGELKFVNYPCDSASIPTNTTELIMQGEDFKVFPIPFSNELNLKTLMRASKVQVCVYSISGSCLHKEKIEIDSEQISLHGLDHLRAGIYFLKIESLADSKSEIFRIVKE